MPAFLHIRLNEELMLVLLYKEPSSLQNISPSSLELRFFIACFIIGLVMSFKIIALSPDIVLVVLPNIT